MKSVHIPLSTFINFIYYVFFNITSSSSGVAISQIDSPLCSSGTTLTFAAMISRHGSRSPLETFPTDEYPYTDKTYWPGGPGELTNLGKKQLYRSGMDLRMRYNGFINSHYNPNETVVMYNPYNRDYMSAACLTASLYPPVGNQVWDPVLRWQPVVQSLRDFDICDLSFNQMCPKYMTIFNSQVENFDKDSNKHKELLDYVSTNAGTNYTKLSQMYEMYDTLLMQAENGYKLPQWTKTVFPYTLRPIGVSYLIEAYAGTYEQLQLSAGPELKYITDMMNAKAKGISDPEKKLYIEVSHDCTLLALLRALGNNESNLEIHTAAYLLFELHYVQPNYFVQTFYFKNSQDKDPNIINIKDCPNPCSLSDFNKFVDKLNPPDYQKACQT